MKVVFFGSSRFVTPTLEMLYNNFDLSLVVTTEQNSFDPVPFFCKNNKVDFISVRKSADIIYRYEIENSMADIGIVADFGIIIPQRLFKTFPRGLINIHPSLLPKYRGPSPAQYAILNGETTTGVTIIKLDKYVDHGPVLAQVEEPIHSYDTSQTLYERLFKIGANLLQKTLLDFDRGKFILIPQNHEHATFTKPLTRDDGYIEIKNFFSGKEFLDRMIRAYYPWPEVWTRAKLSEKEEDTRIVKFVPEKKIQVEGKLEIPVKDFMNGYPDADKALKEFIKNFIE